VTPDIINDNSLNSSTYKMPLIVVLSSALSLPLWAGKRNGGY